MAQLSDVWKREEKVKDRIDKHRRLPSDKIYTRHAKGYHPPPEDPKPNPRNRTKKKKGKKRQDETVPFTIKQLKEMDAEKLKKVYRRYAKNKEDEILNYDDINAMFLEASDDELENLGMFQRKPGEKKWLPPTTYEIPGFYLHDDKYISRTEDLVMLAFNDENDNWLTMHYKSPFVIDGLKFNTVYQYAFFKKVERFTNDRDQMFYVLICDDSKTLSKMNLNLNRSYKTEEVYGFTARNLSLKYWNALHSIDLYKATYAKFKQNDILKQKLLSTGNQLLIQCDGIANGYGCGYFISRKKMMLMKV